MPRYFFHVRNATGREIDSEGLEFNSLNDAIQDARKARGEMLSDEALQGSCDTTSAFEITDGAGQLLATIPFLDS